jgi:hypothetical protein
MPAAEEDSIPSLDASAWTTLVVFAIVSAVMYTFVLKPIFSAEAAPTVQHAHAAAHRPAPTPAPPPPRAAPRAMPPMVESEEMAALMTRRPPHMQTTGSTSGVLVDGMLPFRSIKASTYEAGRDDPELLAANRKDRAKVLSKILSLDQTASPPPRGTTVVVTIMEEDVQCDLARRVIFLLATYFNLLLVIRVPPITTDAEIKGLIANLRGTDSTQVPVQVLADHRIIAAESATGRVALVRQLARRVEFVLDFDPQVRTELNKFGFRVMVYGNVDAAKITDGTSMLGMSLLS